MRWYRNLYLGPNARQNIQKIHDRAVSGRMTAGVYYITLPSSAQNLLDIFHNGMLKLPLFAQWQRTDVVGVAEGRQEALRLAETIIGDIYGRTGSLDLRSYFKDEDFRAD